MTKRLVFFLLLVGLVSLPGLPQNPPGTPATPQNQTPSCSDIQHNPSLSVFLADFGASLTPFAISCVADRSGPRQTDGEFFDEGDHVKFLVADGVAVLATLKADRSNMVSSVYLKNDTNHPVNLIPENFTLMVLDPKPRLLEYRSGEQLTKSSRRRATWAAALAAFSGGMATETTTTQGYVGGDYVNLYTQQPDYAARQQADAQVDRIYRNSRDYQADLSLRALKANTLAPGRDIFGFVHFRRDKKAKFLLLTMRIGDLLFLFPFSTNQSRK